MPKRSVRRILSGLYWKLLGLNDLERIRSLYERRAYSEAYSALRSAMDCQPGLRKDGFVYIQCADLELLANHDPLAARRFLEKAVEVGHTATAYYHSVNARVMWDLGEREEAVTEMERCVAADPSTEHLADLARMLSALKDRRASEVWQQVLEKDPRNCSAQIHAGLDALAAGEQDKAVLIAKRVERLSLSVDDFYELGGLYLELGDYRSAIPHFLKAGELGYGPKGILHALLACCYAYIGEIESVKKHAEYAMQCAPEDERVAQLLRGCQEWGKNGPEGENQDSQCTPGN